MSQQQCEDVVVWGENRVLGGEAGRGGWAGCQLQVLASADELIN